MVLYFYAQCNAFQTLVGPVAGMHVQANREDVVSTGGCILLACFISHSMGPFAAKSLEICSQACKVPASLQPMLESGVIMACTRYMAHLKTLGKLQWLEHGKDNLTNRRDMSTQAYTLSQVPKRQWFDCLLVITRVATHAAGLFRARGKYDKIIPQNVDVEPFSYRELLFHLGSRFRAQVVYDVLGKHFVCTFHPAV